MTQICILTNALQRLLHNIVEDLSSEIVSEKSIPKIVYYLLSISHLKPCADFWICIASICTSVFCLRWTSLWKLHPRSISFLIYQTPATVKVSLEFKHRISDNTMYQSNNTELSIAVHLTGNCFHCAAGFHLTDRNASQFPEASCLSCLFLKPLIDTHEILEDCKLFTGVRNYTSGYAQFLPWFLHSKTSWTCQMYLWMVQTEQWPANGPWPRHVLILWATWHSLSTPKHPGTTNCCWWDGNSLGNLIKYCSVLYWCKRCSAYQRNHKTLQQSEGNNCF